VFVLYCRPAMNPTRLQGALFLGMAACACFAVGQYFSFRSVCVDDLKSGPGTDAAIARPIELENVSVGFVFAGLALLLPAFGLVLLHHDRTQFEAVFLSAVVVTVIAVVAWLAILQISIEFLPFCSNSDLA
jgi:hypothetical protein